MKPTVLIIEDEATLAAVLVDNLEAEGYAVTVAADGQEGLDMWRKKQPEIVVLDVMLPFVDGYEVCRTMRRAGDTTPVLFLSAKGRPDDRVAGLAAGGDDYLPKPFHLPEFLLRVQNMLRRRVWSRNRGQDTPTDSSFTFGGHRVDFRTWTADASKMAAKNL